MNRVVITGIGVISPSGNDIATFWDNIINARSGIDKISKFELNESFRCKIAGEIKDFSPWMYDISKKEAKKMDLFSQYAIAATYMALEDSNLKPYFSQEKIGTIVATGIGGILTTEKQHEEFMKNARVSPYTIPMLMSNAAAGEVSIKFNLTGVSMAVSSACASGTSAIIDAFLRIKNGYFDVIVAGGTEASITPFANQGFATMRALNTQYNDDPHHASMPFNKNRKGFVMSEGSAMLVLETLEHAQKRGAKIYAEIINFGESSDSFHICKPDIKSIGAVAAMNEALKNAKIDSNEISYINAHGTSTYFNDKLEAQAIEKVFGNKTPYVSSTKGVTGHLLGAAGAIETIVCALSIKNAIIPPTANLSNNTVDKDCRMINHVFDPIQSDVKYAINNSFGFGGHNTCLILKKYDQ